MTTIFIYTIITILLTGWQLALSDLPTLYGTTLSTGAFKGRSLRFGALAITLVIILLLTMQSSAPEEAIVETFGIFSQEAILAVGIAAFIAAAITLHICRFSSASYALIGAFFGWKLTTGSTAEWGDMLRYIGSWLSAPILTALLAAAFYKLYGFLLPRREIHLVRQAYHQRNILAVGLLLLSIIFIFNSGTLLTLFVDYCASSSILRLAIPAIVIIILFFLLQENLSIRAARMADREFDLSSQTLIAVIYATILTLTFFSFDVPVRSIGLVPTPLSIVSLILCGIFGIGIVRGRETIERGTMLRSISGIALSPIVGVLAGYCFCTLLNAGTPDADIRLVPNRNITATLLILCATLLVVLLIVYVSHQQRRKTIAEQIASSRQQQLYENQKALNTLEVKAILAENQSLLNKLELKRKELVNVALNISEQKEFLETVYNRIKRLRTIENPEEKERDIDDLQQTLCQRMAFTQEIDSFYTQAEILHKDFGIRLTEAFPNLTEQERRLTTLLRLGFSTKYIATLMNISPKSVEISRYRLRSKLGLKRSDNLTQFIKSI